MPRESESTGNGSEHFLRFHIFCRDFPQKRNKEWMKVRWSEIEIKTKSSFEIFVRRKHSHLKCASHLSVIGRELPEYRTANTEGNWIWINYKGQCEDTRKEINAWKVVIGLWHSEYIQSTEHLRSKLDWNLYVRVRYSMPAVVKPEWLSRFW